MIVSLPVPPLQHSLRPSQFIRRQSAFVTKSLSQSPLNVWLRAPVPHTPMTSLSWVLRATKEHAWGIFRRVCPSVQSEPQQHGKQWSNICTRDIVKSPPSGICRSVCWIYRDYEGCFQNMRTLVPNFTASYPRRQEALHSPP
jgi:hypothetical protein